MAGAGPGWYPDPSRPGSDRYWNGTAWTNDFRASAAAPPQPYTVVVAQTRTTPGIVTTAFICSLIGFCGITALLGLILGLAGRPQAKRNGAGTGLATAAIVISLLWIVPPLMFWFIVGVLMATTPTTTSGTSTAPRTTQSAPAPPRRGPAPLPSGR